MYCTKNAGIFLAFVNNLHKREGAASNLYTDFVDGADSQNPSPQGFDLKRA